jgi:alpha-tubulin suppressor-like RCC1 family protein
MTVAPAALKLVPGAAGGLTVSTVPPGAALGVTWSSDRAGVAEVVGNGMAATVKALGEGTARITVAAADFPFTATCEVTVEQPQPSSRATFAAGGNHSLAIKADGGLWAWGYNSCGQLGLGDGGGGTNRNVPFRVGGDADWAAVSAGYEHSLALKADCSLWAWGDNYYGQLGDGTDAQRNAPVRVGGDNDWVSVSAGGRHSLAIKADGSLWGWGNIIGSLGYGDTQWNVPTRVGGDNDWASAVAGASHALALKVDGGLWTWGNNMFGQLGVGDFEDRTAPTLVGAATDGWAAVAGTYYHTAAIKGDGGLWTWGRNDFGQLGDGNGGTYNHRSLPFRVGAATDTDWAAAATGWYHIVALRGDGGVWAWGRNTQGQLGDGSGAQQDFPVQAGAATDWAAAVAGSYHTLAIRGNGDLWVWGTNAQGQLGLGAVGNQLAPVLVGEGWRVP